MKYVFVVFVGSKMVIFDFGDPQRFSKTNQIRCKYVTNKKPKVNGAWQQRNVKKIGHYISRNVFWMNNLWVIFPTLISFRFRCLFPFLVLVGSALKLILVEKLLIKNKKKILVEKLQYLFHLVSSLTIPSFFICSRRNLWPYHHACMLVCILIHKDRGNVLIMHLK